MHPKPKPRRLQCFLMRSWRLSNRWIAYELAVIVPRAQEKAGAKSNKGVAEYGPAGDPAKVCAASNRRVVQNKRRTNPIESHLADDVMETKLALRPHITSAWCGQAAHAGVEPVEKLPKALSLQGSSGKIAISSPDSCFRPRHASLQAIRHQPEFATAH